MRRHLLAALAMVAGLAGLFAGPSQAQAQNRFWLVNETGRVIERAFVSSNRVSDWGPDILGAGVLPSGNRVWVTPNFTDCVLDVRITFLNGTGATIREVYVSLSTEGGWGSDRLGANVLQPGQRLAVNLPATGVCTVDMRVVYMDGRGAERRRVETCSVNDFIWR